MTSKQFELPFVVQPDSLTNIVANVMGGEGLRNLPVAQTEKYAHVTYFFNGGVEQPFPGEARVLVPSQSPGNAWHLAAEGDDRA